MKPVGGSGMGFDLGKRLACGPCIVLAVSLSYVVYSTNEFECKCNRKRNAYLQAKLKGLETRA